VFYKQLGGFHLMQHGFRSDLEKIHEGFEQLVDDPTSLPVWNLTLTITRAFFNFGEFRSNQSAANHSIDYMLNR
jgi:hypothetical protein